MQRELGHKPQTDAMPDFAAKMAQRPVHSLLAGFLPGFVTQDRIKYFSVPQIVRNRYPGDGNHAQRRIVQLVQNDVADFGSDLFGNAV